MVTSRRRLLRVSEFPVYSPKPPSNISGTLTDPSFAPGESSTLMASSNPTMKPTYYPHRPPPTFPGSVQSRRFYY